MDAGGFFSDAPDAGSVRKQMASVTGGFLGKKKPHLYASKWDDDLNSNILLRCVEASNQIPYWCMYVYDLCNICISYVSSEAADNGLRGLFL